MCREIWLALGLFAGISSLLGQMAEEYPIKAAFLYNFAKFVEWPAQSFPSSSDPVVVCVLGQNPFGPVLEDAVRGKTANNRPLVVRKVSDAQQARQCHILFVSSSERKRLPPLLEELKGACVLTVGEHEEFIPSGGIVNLKMDGERVRLEIDPEAATRARLRISSKLLSLAQTKRK